VVEQLAHGDLGGDLRVCHAEPGQVALYGSVQLNLIRLDQLYDRQGGEGLGH
jgi:hypothetical protein